MKILLAPDSFKGSMASMQVIKILKKSILEHFPNCEIVEVPIGDGGEGTVEAIMNKKGGEYKSKDVSGPLGNIANARYAVIDSEVAIVEMAQASGIMLVPKENLNPLIASSYGTGELIAEIVKKNYKKIILLLGGSATNDGGMGMMSALGAKFYDSKGKILPSGGKYLQMIDKIDVNDFVKMMQGVEITVLCDVDNTLLGSNGATYVYAPQKGAAPEDLVLLESGMKHYADIIEEKAQKSIRNVVGIGAAGGTAFPLLAFCDAKLKGGIDIVLEMLEFDSLLSDVDVVITGEGKIDSQSIHGKVVSGIGEKCKKKGIPVIAIVGSIGDGGVMTMGCGITAIESCVDNISTLQDAISNCEENLRNACDRVMRLIKIGMSIH